MLPVIYGKVPPQAKDLEEAILGAIMIDKNAYEIATQILKPECFYVEAHERIFSAMKRLADKNEPIDILTVSEELRKKEELELVGGPYYVTKLTNSVVSAASIQSHSRIVMQKYLQREIIRISGSLLEEAYLDGTDVFELIDFAEVEINSILKNNIRKPFKSLGSIMVQNYKVIEAMRHRDEHLTGVPSGFDELDMVTCGWQDTDLIILAARPSVGKTALALNLARNAAMHPTKPTPVAIFSLEMKDSQLVNRILSSESGIWLWKIRNARIDDDGMKQLFKKGLVPLGDVPIWIDDTPSLNISEFRSKARQLKNKYNVGMIIIDYLQLMTVVGINNREQQIAHISSELKSTAKELNIPVIALSQLSRAVEQRGGEKEPKLSDIRESGSIEQDADVVIFLWRPTDEEVQQDISLSGVCYVKIEKNRNGDLAKFIGDFQKEIQKWNYLKVVDRNTMKLLGDSWRPVTIPIDFSQPKEKNDPDEPDDNLPF